MVVRMRHTRSHTANRRSHHALKDTNLLACDKCGANKPRHMVCVSCGSYKGKKVLNLDAVKKVEKKQVKAKKSAK